MLQALDVLHQLATLRTKHLAGQHNQQTHAGSRGKAEFKPDKARQQHFYDILNDPNTDLWNKTNQIRGEIEALPGGKDALHAMDRWYYNPGNPEAESDDEGLYSEYLSESEGDEDYQYEDFLDKRSEELDWDPAGDTLLNDMMNGIGSGFTTPAQAEALSAMYDYTQAYIRRFGPSDFQLHRGLALDRYDVAELKPGNNLSVSTLSHWSENETTPAKFAAQGYGESDGEMREVILHRKFKRQDIFDWHEAKATKDMNEAYQLDYEGEVVPITSDYYKIADVKVKKSDWTGDEVTHVWLQ